MNQQPTPSSPPAPSSSAPSSSAPSPSGLVVVLGGSGGIGGALVRELAGQGRRVRAVSRSGRLPFGIGPGAEVEAVAADMTDPGAVADVASGASVVHHALQPDYTRWPEELPPLTRAVLEGVARAGARLVVADNLYMYGRTHGIPLTEATPYAATDRKGIARAAMARELLDAHQEGRVRVTLGRASSYYGPGGLRSSYGAQVFGAAVQGGPVQWIGPLDVPQTMSYLPDVARALAVLGEHDAADGRAWHLPAAAPLTGDRFLRLITGAAGAPHDIRAADRAAIEHLAAHDPFLAEVAEIYFQVEEPWLVDHSDFMTTFGPFEVTAHARAVAATVAWFRAAPDLR